MAGIYLATFVLRGKNRKEIMKILVEGNKTQAELHKITNMYRTHVRRTLNELISNKLVNCINPNDKRYKIYQLTPIGKSTMKKINNLNR